jgi:hypothetical protein
VCTQLKALNEQVGAPCDSDDVDSDDDEYKAALLAIQSGEDLGPPPRLQLGWLEEEAEEGLSGDEAPCGDEAVLDLGADKPDDSGDEADYEPDVPGSAVAEKAHDAEQCESEEGDDEDETEDDYEPDPDSEEDVPELPQAAMDEVMAFIRR